MAKELAEHNGFKVVLVQPLNGKEVPLSHRVETANAEKVDLYLSTHADASGNAGVRGHWSFYWGTSANSKKFAEIWKKNAKELLENPSRGIIGSQLNHWTNFYVLRATNMPANLSENGFMTNPLDKELLLSSAFRKNAARAQIKTACEFFGLPFKDLHQEKKEEQTLEDRHEVITESLNVRNDVMGTIIGKFKAGYKVDKLFDFDGTWWVVRRGELIGFVNSNFLK
ncbi:cell wall hydrolase/autolysin [Alkaliphilus metalliredigens QYMF]|uniref:Cell wall hydrolase/autolysin n=2 Tax=Alkaliphilus TaxID=114627 RepID=A6TKB8_ALKMQ|nr:cell wall hydrolase/autolysin [Alkaliphilus metalliredigens QYMF]ABR48108.1 cell wall hydrolase/autolysin [Alkaliphilus metalliredigens QYMF]ABR50448.1 cell wall hydrolase/autolysin [Alkaliphilus metalliredigens QYMF]